MEMKNVAIITGGNSGEYEISIKSAEQIKLNLDANKYSSKTYIISSEKWVCLHNDNEYKISKEDFSVDINGEIFIPDVVFVGLHGTPGEDGKMQSYFDLINLPYTSCNASTSALTFNKFFCNKVVDSLGVKISDSICLFKGRNYNPEQIVEKLGLPLFVKPNSGGSSIGISKVNKLEELQQSVELAFNEDDEVLIEAFIPGTELGCGVMRYKEELIVFPIIEIVSSKEFFDYQAKYTSGMAEEIVPARIPIDIEIDCKAQSAYLYEQLNCKGVVRLDFILNDKGLFFLELNTVPGLSKASLLPQQANEMGISLAKLFDMMLEEALVSRK